MANTQLTNQRLGRIGIWSLELRYGDRASALDAAAELDQLGFGTLWVPGGVGGNLMGDVEALLAATPRTMIATGILNIWKHTPQEVGLWWKQLPADKQRRVMLGLGVSHSSLIGDAYKKPLTVMRAYLDGLTKAGLPADSLCLAALGPKMLELSRDRTAGAHPYLVTPEHSAVARKVLGPNKLLAPEQGVILERDPAQARALARGALTHYLTMPNYTNSWRRLGFSAEDVATVSDRLVDGLFAWGGVERIVERVNAHLAAGADHVCLQVVTGAKGGDFGPLRSAWRELAAALL
jgi:probable F420-dependent oxidoreductase